MSCIFIRFVCWIGEEEEEWFDSTSIWIWNWNPNDDDEEFIELHLSRPVLIGRLWSGRSVEASTNDTTHTVEYTTIGSVILSHVCWQGERCRTESLREYKDDRSLLVQRRFCHCRKEKFDQIAKKNQETIRRILSQEDNAENQEPGDDRQLIEEVLNKLKSSFQAGSLSSSDFRLASDCLIIRDLPSPIY